jgi:hypothetical protein
MYIAWVNAYWLIIDIDCNIYTYGYVWLCYGTLLYLTVGQISALYLSYVSECNKIMQI